MRRTKSTHTKPELRLRKLVYSLGYRYRPHRKDLPGRPDLVFASRRTVIFVHGCFWHQHNICVDGRIPRSKTEYWLPKLNRNVERDSLTLAQIEQMGWKALVVWECELENAETIKQVEEKIRRFLE